MRHGLLEPEEPGAGPVSAGDRPGNLGQRGIMATVIVEALLGHGDRVGAAAPFAHKPGARLDLRARIKADLAIGLECRGEARELADRSPCEPAISELLQTIGDGAHEKIAAEARRLRPEEAPPFDTKLG